MISLRLCPGCQYFFVVSGYLIAQSFNRSVSLSDFYLKRFFHVYPALFVNIIVLEIIVLSFGQHKYV